MFSRYGVDNQTGRGRIVIEPPEMDAALAGISLSSGVAEAARQGYSTAGVDAGNEERSDTGHGTEDDGDANKRARETSDSVNVHASDGGLTPSPVARRGRPRTRSTSSSGSSTSRGGGRRDQRKLAMCGRRLPPLNRRLRGTWRSTRGSSLVGATWMRVPSATRQRAAGMSATLISTATDDWWCTRGEVIKCHQGENGSGKRNKEAGQPHMDVGIHESEQMVRENLGRSPRYGDYVPMFSPPPPFPGYVHRGGYVLAATAGSSSVLARDAQYGASRDHRHEGRQSGEGERARSRGRSVSRRRVDDRARSPEESRARSRGRSVARRQEGDRARSRGRSVGPRANADAVQQGGRHQGDADRPRCRSRSRSRR